MHSIFRVNNLLLFWLTRNASGMNNNKMFLLPVVQYVNGKASQDKFIIKAIALKYAICYGFYYSRAEIQQRLIFFYSKGIMIEAETI